MDLDPFSRPIFPTKNVLDIELYLIWFTKIIFRCIKTAGVICTDNMLTLPNGATILFCKKQFLYTCVCGICNACYFNAFFTVMKYTSADDLCRLFYKNNIQFDTINALCKLEMLKYEVVKYCLQKYNIDFSIHTYLKVIFKDSNTKKFEINFNTWNPSDMKCICDPLSHDKLHILVDSNCLRENKHIFTKATITLALSRYLIKDIVRIINDLYTRLSFSEYFCSEEIKDHILMLVQ
jgi:hypothetical protein